MTIAIVPDNDNQAPDNLLNNGSSSNSHWIKAISIFKFYKSNYFIIKLYFISFTNNSDDGHSEKEFNKSDFSYLIWYSILNHRRCKYAVVVVVVAVVIMHSDAFTLNKKGENIS